MTIHPRGVLVAAVFGLLVWLAVDVRWAAAIALATFVLDWLSFAGVVGLGRRR